MRNLTHNLLRIVSLNSFLVVVYYTLVDLQFVVDVYLEVYDKDRFAKCLWDRGTSKQLNLSQLEAIAIALEYRFQLIQGPPGIEYK